MRLHGACFKILPTIMGEEKLVEISINHEGEDFLAFVRLETANVLLNGEC